MDANYNSSSSVSRIIGAIIAVLGCCACAVTLGAAGLLYYEARSIPLTNTTPPFLPPILGDTQTSPPPIELTRPPVESIPPDTLQTLLMTVVPENDPYELACRLEKICGVPRTVQGKFYQVGDRETFWIVNADSAEPRQAEFTLLYVTPHSYFWAEDAVEVNQAEVQALMDEFENKIYPTDREFFGSEWTPGVDGDEHIYVIYANGLGTGVAGYFFTKDSFNPLIVEFSNAHETFMLSANENLGAEDAYSTLAHEFVHMIQHPTDRNDASWMVEGFADVGILINGYYPGGGDWLYIQDPDLQLNTWVDNSSPDFSRHYGQSFLYLAYLLDRFGEEVTKAITSNPEDDLESIDHTLAQLNITDPQTGRVVTADDIFMDWAATLYLRDGSVGDGRYTYHNYPEAPQYNPVDFISSCPQALSGTVNQYGIDYLTINCAGDYTLHFSGSTVTRLLPMDAYSGEYAFWSNKGNESDMTLTREFDLTNVSGPITLSYQTWFDIEEDWDYLYLEASTDGENWEILQTPSCKNTDPSGQSFGCAYTGQSGDWIQESVDLSRFAGQKVQIRFEYITDALVNGEGLLVDDVRVDAINYTSDFEADEGGWVASGFARVQNELPQIYRLSLILRGDSTTVTSIELNSDNTADIPLSLQRREEAVLIVSSMTRFTSIPAAYQIEIR